MIRVTGWLIAMLLILNSGCAAERRDSKIDRLWRQGYGFNNPNPERIKNGCAPVNLDGSTSGGD